MKKDQEEEEEKKKLDFVEDEIDMSMKEKLELQEEGLEDFLDEMGGTDQ